MRAPGKLKINLIFLIIIIVFILVCCNSLLYIYYNDRVQDNLFNLIVPLAYNKDKFKHVININQLNLFRENIKDVLIGSLLGDGSIVRSGRGRNQFRFKQSIRKINYFYFMFFIFEPYITKGSPIYEKYLDLRYNKYYESLLLQTRPIHNELLYIDQLKSRFYTQKDNISIKEIDFSKVKAENFLRPISLAF